MRKGQIGFAVIVGMLIAVVVLVIGVGIVNSTVHPYCHGDYVCYADHNFTDNAYFDLPNGNIFTGEKVYNASTCSGGLIGAVNYTMNYTNGGILVASGFNTTNQSIEYNYQGANYLGGLNCTIIDNWAILFAIGGLIIAIAWIATRP